MYTLTDYKSLCRGNDWTDCFAAAVADIAKDGGGTLLVPAGDYESRSIELTGGMTLIVENGAYIRFSDDMDAYERIELDFEGYPHICAKPLLYARSCKNVTVTGGGTLDGNGMKWWQAKRNGTLPCMRPYLVCFNECEDVMIEGLTLVNSPVWTVHPLLCDRVTVRNLTIRNPYDSPNTDGIDPDYSSNVTIENCTIDVGDDCIAIKSGTQERTIMHPSENITITNCRMVHGHGALVLGSEMSGDIRNVTLSSCEFSDTDRGLRIKTNRGRGGRVSGIVMKNVTMNRVMCPFVINMRYTAGKDGRAPAVSAPEALPVNEGTPAVSDVTLTDIVCENCTSAAGFFDGLPESPVERVTVSNVSVSMIESDTPRRAALTPNCIPTSRAGFFLKCVRDVSFRNIRMDGVEGDKYISLGDTAADVDGVKIG